MKEFKYVVTEGEQSGVEIFVFPKSINHDEFAKILSYIKVGYPDWKREYKRPISAGFTDGKTCYGRSESLRLDSHPDDTKLLLGE